MRLVFFIIMLFIILADSNFYTQSFIDAGYKLYEQNKTIQLPHSTSEVTNFLSLKKQNDFEYNSELYMYVLLFEFNNRPIEAVNYLTFETPLVVTNLTIRPALSNTNTNNAILVTGQTVLRAGTSTQVNSVNTASLFVKGSYPIRVPINGLSGGVATVSTFTAIAGTPNIYGVTLLSTATWAFAIEQLSSTQTSGLSVNSSFG